MILQLFAFIFLLAFRIHAAQGSLITYSSSYTVFQAVSFNGSNTNTSTGCNILNSILLQCLSVETSKLGDGDVGPLNHLTADNLEHFFAFSRHSTNGLGRTTFNIRSSVSSVVLYFFNSPQDKIGLPHIQVFGSIEEGSPFISYWFNNNNDLNQSDTRLRNITLNLQRNANISLELAFTFPNNSQIDWLLLSEMILCNDTVGRNVPMDPITFTDGNMSIVLIKPQDLSSTITLSCTVVNSGSFEWQWFHNGTTIDDSQIFIKDATRTSTLIINDFRYANLGNYTCSVNHITDTVYYQRILTVTDKVTPSDSITEQSSMEMPLSAVIAPSTADVLTITQEIVDSSHLFISTSIEIFLPSTSSTLSIYALSTYIISATFTYITSTSAGGTESTTAITFSPSATSTPLMQPACNDCVPVIISVPIAVILMVLTSILSSLVSSLVTYYCCLLKRNNSYSPTGHHGDEISGGVVPAGEMKDNMPDNAQVTDDESIEIEAV